jgi:hypothetical protein
MLMRCRDAMHAACRVAAQLACSVAAIVRARKARQRTQGKVACVRRSMHSLQPRAHMLQRGFSRCDTSSRQRSPACTRGAPGQRQTSA